MPKRRPHGAGHVYRPTYRAADGTTREQKIWWLAFWHGGRLVRESAQTESKTEAEKILRRRMVARDAGLYAGPDARKTTLADIRKIREDNYGANGRGTQSVRMRRLWVAGRAWTPTPDTESTPCSKTSCRLPTSLLALGSGAAIMGS